MKIKNIQEYRSFYKNEIRRLRLPDRNENFIGNFLKDSKSNDIEFGWFEIYHGDKEGYGKAEEGIENFLQSFLDMAKDGQAVYEFLQNAVDAASSHYAMFWGQDEIDGNHYLLVANNGKMFSLDSVRSILNVGSSTKSNDSQTIGKFGIGFKLAHRLVGKDNGLQELINEHSGPILFSWKNYEIEKLAGSHPVEPIKFDYTAKTDRSYEMADDYPWLFKILLTCFPCLPENKTVEELPKMANGQLAKINPFSGEEYGVLSRWVNKHQHILDKETYNEGSIFFIKLGKGKEEELAEVNLKEGVKFALAILKETANEEEKNEKLLQIVQLNDNAPITYPNLEYIKIKISKQNDKDTYAYIRFGVETYQELSNAQQRKMAEEADIEALFGFRKYNKIEDYFKGAPNLYLYFPLSEEVHNFNYILHSNAFYKGSSRTFLHQGNSKEDGINERLLKVLVKKIDMQFNDLSKSQDLDQKSLFLDFYASLLTSGKSINKARLWIETPFIDPVDNLLLNYIPILNNNKLESFETVGDNHTVFIKKTDIAIDPLAWKLQDVNWFYWRENDHDIIQKAQEKLKIPDYTIFNLLENPEIQTKINDWVNEDHERIKLILKELTTCTPDKPTVDRIRPQLIQLKLFKFSNGELLSLSEFLQAENKGYFLLHNNLGSIKDLLQKTGLITTELDLKEFEFVEKYRTFLLQSSKHSGYTELTKLFSDSVNEEKLLLLSNEEKLKIFNAFRTFNGESINERIRELKLFENNLGNPMPFKSLLAPKQSNNPWLSIFSIPNKHYSEQFKSYLLNDKSLVYQQIIYPYWQDILSYVAKNSKAVNNITTDIQSLFSESNWNEKQQHLLSNHQLILFQGAVVTSDNFFYRSPLLNLSEEVFSKVQSVLFKIYKLHIPDTCLIKHLDELPLSYSSVIPKLYGELNEISLEDLNVLVYFCNVCDIDFFEYNIICFDMKHYQIKSKTGLKQYFSSDKRIIDYVTNYHSKDFILIPPAIEIIHGTIKMSGTALIEQLIELFTEQTMEQELHLIEIVLNERQEDKSLLLNSLTYIKLDASWQEENQNELYLKLIDQVFDQTLEDYNLSDLQHKIIIYNENKDIYIGTIESAQDVIEVMRDNRSIYLSQSKILDLKESQTISLVQHFHDEALSRNLIAPNKADKVFKISSIGITDDMVNRFEKVLRSLKLLKNALPIINSHQLAFVLLSNKYSVSDLKKFAVKSHNNDWYLLNGKKVLYSKENQTYINPGYLLDEQYSDLQTTLALGEFDIFNFSENEDDIFIPKFLFIKGLDTNILKSNANIKDKLDYLFHCWKGLSPATRDSKKDAVWENFLDLNPVHHVMNGICIENESLPVSFLEWCNNEKPKQDLLRNIGIFVNDRFLESLRKFLLKETTSILEEIDPLKFNNTILINTLKGLCGEFIGWDNQPVVYDTVTDNARISIIERIIAHLMESGSDCPLLVYNDSNTYSLANLSPEQIWKIESEIHFKLKHNLNNNLDHIYTTNYIIKSDLLSIDDINNRTDEFDFKKEFTPLAREEHDEPFYHNWSAHHSIKLIRQDQLQFKIFDSEQHDRKYIGTITEGVYYISTQEHYTTIYYTKSSHLEGLQSALEESQRQLSEAIGDLISRRDAMLASIYNAYNSANIDDVTSEHLKALQEAFREQDLKQQRTGLINDIKENTKYSYDWFISYLDYLLTFNNNTSDNNKQKTIRFQSIKRQVVDQMISGKYFLLRGASSYISDSIEDASDFSLSITMKNNKRIELIAEGAQKQFQDLLIFCPNGISKEITENLDAVFQIEISFIPQIDLLKELKNAFANDTNLNRWQEIKEALPALQFIYGPPGTGKTTTLCKKIIEIKEIDPKAKILFLTPTNKAADVLCKKLLKPSNNPNDKIDQKLKKLQQSDKFLNITRIGRPTDPELETLDKEIYQFSLNDAIVKYSDMLAMTIHRLPYASVFTEELNNEIRLFKLENHWDYLIFDEASMINLPYLVFAIMAVSKYSPSAKIIIAGDPNQIPPVVDVNDKEFEELDIQDENVYRMMDIQSFDTKQQSVRTGDSIENLSIQYRSIGEIGHLFSKLSYGGLLKHHREEIKSKPKELTAKLKNLISSNVQFIDIPLNYEDSVFKIRQLFYSSYHIYSAILVSEVIKYFDHELQEGESWSIGLIAPYKAQAVMMSKLISSFGISDKIKIYVDTVHGFQGDECDLVFFICNPNNYNYRYNTKSLLSKEYIYNVAISRARDYLIVIHPFSTISNNEFINTIKDTYQNRFGTPVVKKSSEIEAVIFSDNNFIYENSYITGHDTINVFGAMEKKYVIKANAVAVDIQLRKS